MVWVSWSIMANSETVLIGRTLACDKSIIYIEMHVGKNLGLLYLMLMVRELETITSPSTSVQNVNDE